MKWKDEIVEEVRKAREAYAAQFDYDLKPMFEDLRQKEEQDPAPRANLRLLKPHEQRALRIAGKVKLMAGYSKRSLAEKLGIKQGFRMATLNAPGNYRAMLGELPSGVTVDERPETGMDLIHCFVKSRREAASTISALKQKIAPQGALWVSWPKGSSRVSTDLNENVIREIGLKAGLVDVKVCAVDDTWSGLKFVYRLKDRPQ